MLENILRAYHCHLFKKKEPFIPGGGGGGGRCSWVDTFTLLYFIYTPS